MTMSRRNRSVSIEPSLQHLEARHRALLAQLADLGMVLRGSIARRLTHCGNPTCRCKADPPKLHGPYYIWTRKLAGKTVTAQLKPEHAMLYREWNRNMRKLDRTVRQLQAVGLKAAILLRGR